MNSFRKFIIATMLLVLLGIVLAGCAKEVIEAPIEPNDELAFIYDDAVITLGDKVDDQKMEDMLGKANEIKSHTYDYVNVMNFHIKNRMVESISINMLLD